MPHTFRPGQAYRAPGPGVWIVEAVYHGPAFIFADDRKPAPTLSGVVHFRNQELGYRLVARVDDSKLDKMTRI